MQEQIRPRRLRRTSALREMVRETRVSKQSLIWPVFVCDGHNIFREIPSLPGQFHYSVDQLFRVVDAVQKSGITKVILFGLPEQKDEQGCGAYAENGVVQRGVRQLKGLMPSLYILTDICLCEYTSHGHCGVLCEGEVENDATVQLLAKTALSHARAGADMVAPSDMMDGRVAAIRSILDKSGFSHIPIMSYSAKFASAFYGPFREAAGSAPAFGDRKSYQMDYHNAREAMRECQLDLDEGADILMIKPAMSYLDLVHEAKARFDAPIAAYAVSGEYAMVKTAAAANLIDEYQMMCEAAICVYRAGADILITYFANELAAAIDRGDIG